MPTRSVQSGRTACAHFGSCRRRGLTYAPRALAVWSALPLVVLGAAGLSVDSLSPDALCPPLEETRAAVAARLGSVELDGTWRATYLLVHRRQGDFVSLSLRDPNDVLRLERDLPVQGGSCGTLSRVIALVLERFFLRPEQATPVEPTSELEAPAETALAPTTSSGAVAPPPAEAPPAVTAPSVPPSDAVSSPPPPEPDRYHLGAAVWASTGWLAPSVRVARQLSGPYQLVLDAGFDLRDHEARLSEGSASLRRAPLALGCERELELSSSVSATAAVELLGVLEVARTRDLRESGDGMRLVPGLAARLGTRFFTNTAVQPFVDLTAAWLLRQAAPAFQVASRVTSQEVLAPPALVFGLALGISTPF